MLTASGYMNIQQMSPMVLLWLESFREIITAIIHVVRNDIQYSAQ